ncbi:hypothetical protein EJ03DRAFT_351854 [Teratosphaeria nubilosa]|uniref:DUF1711-domain-containing protein n=1 Tax=Teratosphaeria nubilosa TaxID=161662 RepID=A0A6G1L7D6_9PEZI|nr:hypothetical protein EJ03DRAFT_351854 [Teratosphaeria nubilosa]
MSTLASSTPKSATKGSTAKNSRVITLRLSQALLTRFPSDSTPHASATPARPEPTPSVQLPDADKTSEFNVTPNPTINGEAVANNSLAPPKAGDKRKRGGGATAGRRRAPPSIDPNGPIRERGRPGPKKKPRLPDGTIDRSQDAKKGALGGPNTVAAHRLGPKANTGNINANLRALDRTGKPCRRWEKKPLQLKSFTGTVWGLGGWKGNSRDNGFAGDVKSDSTGSSDLKPNESSAVQSERSNSGVDAPVAADVMQGIESSPAPPIAA